MRIIGPLIFLSTLVALAQSICCSQSTVDDPSSEKFPTLDPLPPQSRFGISNGAITPGLSATDLGRMLDGMKSIGAGWLRIDLDWSATQATGPTSYNWASTDGVVRAAHERGIRILGCITYTPAWARPANTDSKHRPDDVNAYAAFARAAAGRYAQLGVHHWEIWNEPNVSSFWKPQPDPAYYTRLLQTAYRAIKEADPAAWVVSGGMAPAPDDGVNIAPASFLQALYSNGARPSFDAVGHHPYSFPNMPSAYANWSAWSQMSQTSPSLRSVMIAAGDEAKKIWLTEYGAPTNGPAGSHAVSEAGQAAMLTEAYRLSASYSWAGPLFWYSYRDLGTNTADRENFFGLLRVDWSPKPGYSSFQSLPKP